MTNMKIENFEPGKFIDDHFVTMFLQLFKMENESSASLQKLFYETMTEKLIAVREQYCSNIASIDELLDCRGFHDVVDKYMTKPE